jgi:hypothetical protein
MNLDVSTDPASPEEAAHKAANLVQHWIGELDQARVREKDFRKEGQRFVELYEGSKKAEYQFNILYSNTETLAPALYNSVPRPVVQRRFKDADPLGAQASKAGQRILEYLIDDGMSEYATFDELMKSTVLEALVPGRGVTRFKYDAKIEQVQNEQAAEQAETAGLVTDPDEDAEQEGHVAASPERVTYETVCGEEVPWDRFLHGYAKKWKDVPWVAYEHFMTKEELEQNFGPMGARVPVAQLDTDSDDTGAAQRQPEAMKGIKVACVYEIWDKVTRTVLFITPNYKDMPLKQVPDPLGLSGFFNCPKPLGFLAKISTLVPVALYTLYEEQAKELNRVTTRINKIVAALKVRGMYDSTVQGLEKVLEADDNVLVPAENVAALLANGNALEKAIWLVPIEKLISVLQQLYLQRNQVKQVIYEITGIADIMRGSSQASETLGAQELKNQWGTLRLKRLQKEVARYARDSLRIMLEIAVSKLSADTIQSMTGLPYPTGAQKQQAQAVMQQFGQMGQQPPQEVAGQLQQVLSQPSWDEILALLQNDLQRSYRIDIETNSTVDAEATEDKQNIAELLNAISQFLNGVSPLVQSGSMPFEVASGMLLAIVRRFRFGPELEDQLKEMKAPPPPPPDPKVQADAANAQADLQMKQMEIQQKQLEIDARRKELAMEAVFKQQEHAMKMAEMQRKGELALLQHNTKMQQVRAQAIAAAAKPTGNTGQ